MHCLEKSPGHALKIYPELYRCFRRLRPAIAHARNFVALDASVLAWLARVPVRMHGKHGRDVSDLRASSMHQFIRRIYRPFVNHYVARSLDLASYIVNKIHIRFNRVTQIYNGVDSVVFRRADSGLRQPIADCFFVDSDLWIFWNRRTDAIGKKPDDACAGFCRNDSDAARVEVQVAVGHGWRGALACSLQCNFGIDRTELIGLASG